MAEMRTAYLVSGLVLLVLGIGLASLALSWTGAPCTDDPAVVQDLGIPLCIRLVAQQAAVGVGGLAFVITGIVLLTGIRG